VPRCTYLMPARARRSRGPDAELPAILTPHPEAPIVAPYSALALLLAAALPTPAPAANLLADPGFESGRPLAPKPGDGWYAAYGDASSRRVVQTGGAHSGERCLRLEAPSIPPLDPAVTVEQAVPVKPGQAYVVRFWSRGTPTGARAMLVVVWLAGDRGWVSSAATEFPLTDAWETHRVIAVAPEGAALGVARFDIRQPGTAWVDDAYMGPHEAARLVTSARDGDVAAGQDYEVAVTAADADGAGVPGATLSCRLISDGDGRLLSGPRVVADEAGRGVVHLRASRRPGRTDELHVSAGSASWQLVATTARQVEPAGWAVSLPGRTAGPGEVVPVTLQLLGAFGEPAACPGTSAALSVSGGGSASPARVTTDGHGRAAARLRLPATLYAQAVISVCDEAGRTGACDPVVVAPPVRANVVTLGPNGFLRNADGTPFVSLGGLYANWVHKVDNGAAGDLLSYSFSDATDDQLRAWFSYLHDNGINALRAMLRDHTAKGCEPMDIVGAVNPSLLRRWEHMMALARPYGIRFLVTLHESWYATYAAYHNADALKACVLPYYTEAQLAALPPYRRRFLVEQRMLNQTTDALTDPDVLACQRDYLTDLIPRLRANPDIFAYEIENEQPCGYVEWTAAQLRLVRELDPVTPLCLSHLGTDAVPWARVPNLDFFTYHPYPGGNTSPEMDYGAQVTVTARYAGLGKPALSGEGIGEDWGGEARRLGARDAIWPQLVAGRMGCLVWNTGDEQMKQFRLAQRVLERLDLTRVRRGRPRVGIDVTHPLRDDAYFQSPAGRELYAALGRAVRICGRRGLDYDLTFEPGRYAVPVEPRDLTALRSLGPEVVVPSGYEAQYLLSEDGASFLCYLRNIAGTTPIMGDPAQGWTRRRAPRHLRVTLQIPLAAQRLEVLDLDDGAARTLPCRRGHVLDLGVTDHDVVLYTPTR
jgi:hypothetical protein